MHNSKPVVYIVPVPKNVPAITFQYDMIMNKPKVSQLTNLDTKTPFPKLLNGPIDLLLLLGTGELQICNPTVVGQ